MLLTFTLPSSPPLPPSLPPLLHSPTLAQPPAHHLPYSHRPSRFLPSAGTHLLSGADRFRPLPSQKRPDNIPSGDTDEMYDDLLDKYGKVVFRRTDLKSPIAEADDDAESLSFAVALAEVACEVKAADIKVLFVKPLVYWTRFFIIATAFSRPQVDAMGSKIRDLAEKKFKKVASGDSKPNSWTLLDFGDVVVHIFLPQQRAFYNLEEFYANAIPIELPFDGQSPFRN